tara:strand:- start:2403 stop:3161 length:759 start_codon:yes stop_codon:yes gene_type:complete
METQEITRHIVEWLRAYSYRGFVVGVSGGVDSAVTSTLCAMTGRPTIAVYMPEVLNTKQSTLAEQHMAELALRYSNIESKTLEMYPLLHNFKLMMSRVGCDNDLALANSKSRFRMLTLYHIAQANELLVCGTGNKVEDFGVGFFTKHGDGGVDISPIGDLMKSEVYELGRHLEVNEKILEAPPTDGLWTDGRTDEDQLGITYDEAEWAMKLDEKGEEPSDPLSERTYKIYKEWHTKNHHKMKPIPVCIIPRH